VLLKIFLAIAQPYSYTYASFVHLSEYVYTFTSKTLKF